MRRVARFAALAALAIGAGCQTTPARTVVVGPSPGAGNGGSWTTSPRHVDVRTSARQAPPSENDFNAKPPPGQSVDEVVGTSPCAMQLEDVSGALLSYWVVNKHLPPRLDDIKAFADEGTDLRFKCPVSHQDYIYVPNGLAKSPRGKRIIVYDAIAAHNGFRWCILMADNGPGKALSMDVRAIPESIFRQFLPLQ